MRRPNAVWTACVFALLLGTGAGLAQTAVAPETVDELHAMAQRAAVIFAGQVVAVRQRGSMVEIDFAVEDAVRGVAGGSFTLREWAGLWQAGEQPLHVGQRYLMLLHAAGPAGLSSPVGGADGAIPIVAGSGASIAQPGAAVAANDGRVVDLRWVAARVTRNVSYAADPARSRAEKSGLRPAAARGDASAAGAGYAPVLELLRNWDRAGDAAR